MRNEPLFTVKKEKKIRLSSAASIYIFSAKKLDVSCEFSLADDFH